MNQSGDAYSILMDVIRRRRCVRKFEAERRIERDVLLKIAEAARWAPTGANSQCFDIVIVDDPEMREACSTSSWRSPID